MKAILVEGVAGSGKTSYIADDVRDRWIPGSALMLTFSRTGRDVLKLYLEHRQVRHANVHTIDGFACQLLRQLGDTRFVLNRTTIQADILPVLYQQVADQMLNYAELTQQYIALPSPSPILMQELMEDMDFYRASCAFDYDDDDILEELLSGKLNHDWRLIRRLFAAYETYRETWNPNIAGYHKDFFEWEDEPIQNHMPYGEQGFRTLGEAVYDLLDYVEESDILEKIGQRYTQQFIDEFHDTTPLQLRFLLRLAKSAQYVVAVGDRFQNIFAWRGTNTAFVFDQFVKQLNASTQYLNLSYRYGQNVADLASHVIQRPISSHASHTSTITSLDTKAFANLHRETVVISKDLPAQISAAFSLFTHSKNKLAFNIAHSVGVSILNILCVLRYDYLLDPKSRVVKNIAKDLAQFLQLPQCLLSEQAKQELLNKPSLQTIRMYFDIHLSSAEGEDRASYQYDFANTLLAWKTQANCEHQYVYDIMEWFEQSARLWSSTTQRMYDRISRAAWEALKEDARTHQYTLAQWSERANTLHRRWNDREGIRFVTVNQAKGREYDSVLVYHANKNGFLIPQDELAQHLFYVAITRAKKQLLFYISDQKYSTKKLTTYPVTTPSTTHRNSQKSQALEVLREIKKQLQNRHNLS